MRTAGKPWRRKVVIRLFKLLSRRRAHWQEGWPGLGIERPAGGLDGAVLWRGRPVAALRPAAHLARRMGREVVLFGSGPSLSGQDLRSVPPGSALLVNGALALAPRLGGALAACVADERFVWAHAGMLARHLPAVEVWMLSAQVMRAMLSLDPGWLEGRDVVFVDNLLHPYRGRRRRLGELPAGAAVERGEDGAALSTDPDGGVVDCSTVAFQALQFALAASPSRIGLAGIDLAGFGEPRFYESAGRVEPTFLDRRLHRILPHFRLAADVAAARGVRMECYSPRSALLGFLPYSDRLAPA